MALRAAAVLAAGAGFRQGALADAAGRSRETVNHAAQQPTPEPMLRTVRLRVALEIAATGAAAAAAARAAAGAV